jgi:hypothetical protein
MTVYLATGIGYLISKLKSRGVGLGESLVLSSAAWGTIVVSLTT